MKKLQVLLFAFLFAITGTYAQKVEDIIDKHIEALGGSTNLANLKSAQIDATVSVASFSVKGTTTVLQNKGIRIEQEVQGMKMIQAFDGTTGWAINPMLDNGNPVKLPESQNVNLKGQMDLTGLYNYKAKGYQVELIGEEQVKDEPVYVLKVTMADGNAATNYISKKTFLTLRTWIHMTTENGDVVESNIYPSDYRKVDGIVTPYSIQIEGTGIPGTIVTNITSVRYNLDIDPSIFAFPEN